MQVVDVDAVLDGAQADVVGGADDLAALDAAAGQPHREAVRVVVAAVVAFAPSACGRTRRPRRPASSSSRPRRFRSVQQAGDRLVASARHSWPWLPSMSRVGVPARCRVAAVDLHEADAALDQPPGQQAALAELGASPCRSRP